jgi:hypothetical protein
VDVAFADEVAEALPVEAGEEAFALCRAVADDKALAASVCVVADVGGV